MAMWIVAVCGAGLACRLVSGVRASLLTHLFYRRITALHVAAYHGQPGCVARLVLLGADLQAKGPEGLTALELACRRADEAKVGDKPRWDECVTLLRQAPPHAFMAAKRANRPLRLVATGRPAA